MEAIGAVYPKSQVQRCIVHQIRSSTRFVSYKDIKPLMLYLASRKIVEHWTARCRNWDMVLAQLQLMSQDRQIA